ncbi:MAG: hypothetical protein RMK32_04250 [Anaerolineae bacterium]|nr:hypothetical protein [Thermoflexus sp.]MDW8064824.1 hypothetical protein [Anaerolineae bacterium]
MPDLAHWLDLHAIRLREGFRGNAAFPLPPVAFSPEERALFQIAERVAEALRPVEPRSVWVSSLYERLIGKAHQQRCMRASLPRPSRWWLPVILGTAALGVWTYRRLHALRH